MTISCGNFCQVVAKLLADALNLTGKGYDTEESIVIHFTLYLMTFYDFSFISMTC